MNELFTKQRIYSLLMGIGSGVLLFRTIRLLFFENGLPSLAYWVIVLTVLEMIIDLICLIFSIKWLFSNSEMDKTISLRSGASAAILHAFRVLIYVLGRIGPWMNFDKKPGYHSSAAENFFWVYFAAILSVSGIIGVIIIWIIRRKSKKNTGKVH